MAMKCNDLRLLSNGVNGTQDKPLAGMIVPSCKARSCATSLRRLAIDAMGEIGLAYGEQRAPARQRLLAVPVHVSSWA